MMQHVECGKTVDTPLCLYHLPQFTRGPGLPVFGQGKVREGRGRKSGGWKRGEKEEGRRMGNGWGTSMGKRSEK